MLVFILLLTLNRKFGFKQTSIQLFDKDLLSIDHLPGTILSAGDTAESKTFTAYSLVREMNSTYGTIMRTT